MNLERKIAGFTLPTPVMNAAGTCRLPKEVDRIAHSDAGAVVIGSFTVEPRGGNEGDVYYADKWYSLNSLGLPNRGLPYLKEYLPRMVSIAHDAGKPLIVSVAGFSPQEYGDLTMVAFHGGADLVEVNLGCPNVWGAEGQKRIASFDPDLVAEIFRAVERRVGTEAKIAVKISPFSDPLALTTLAKVIANSALIKVVTTTNTFPNGFAWNEAGKPAITPANGLAGMGGPAMKPIGLGQVRQLRAALPEWIQIVGVGGVMKGKDVLDYLRAGATAVQVATAYLQDEDLSVFSRILAEYVELTEDHM